MIAQEARQFKLFPLQDYTKIPAVQWLNYDNHVPDDTITYGINCKESNLVVVDLDNHNLNADGIVEWINLTMKENITETFSVATPNEGLHYYYYDTSNGEIKNSAGKLAPGIDIRANGGYVVGPGSIVIDNNNNEKTYTIENNVEILPLPDFLKNKLLLLQQPNNHTLIKSQDLIDPIKNDTNFLTEKDSEELLTDAFKQIMLAENGTRNDTLNRLCFTLGKSGINPKIVIERMSAAAIAIGLTAYEIDRTVRQSTEKGSFEYTQKLKKDQANEKKASKENKLSPLESPSGYFSDVVMTYRLKKVLLEENYRHDSIHNSWRHYDDITGVWNLTSYDEMIERITKWCHNEVKLTALNKDADMIKASMRCLNKTTVSSLLILAKGSCRIDGELFDKNKDNIIVENGVVDLKNKKLKPFNPLYYSTKRIALPWDENIVSNNVEKILEALPYGTRDWFIVMAGQSLTGRQPSNDTMFFMKGNGSNGKSTILNLMTATAGDYGGLPPQASLIRTKNSDNFNTIVYKGIHQAIIEEMPDKQLDTVRMKNLTGTDKITARGLYQNNETFDLKCTVWVSCNILPQVIEYDYGTWRRIVLIEFDKTFKKNEKDIIHENDRLGSDTIRLAALHDRNTHIAFLNMRINGAYEWYKNRMSDPKLPKPIVEATERWKNKGDNIRSWYNESIIRDADSYCLNEDLRDSYNNWLTQHGYAKVSHKVFLERLENHDIFQENDLKIIKNGRTGSFQHSKWYDPQRINDSSYSPRSIIKTASHIRGIKFR